MPILGCIFGGLALMWAADWKYRIGWLWWCGFAGFLLGVAGAVFLMIGYGWLAVRDRLRKRAAS